MKNEIKAQLKRIEMQIVTENEVYKSMKKYTESEIKAAVINQQIGVVRGLEVAKESLTYLLNQADNKQMSLSLDRDVKVTFDGEALPGIIIKGRPLT